MLASKDLITILSKFQQTVTLSRLWVNFWKKKNTEIFKRPHKMSIKDWGTVEKITQKLEKSLSFSVIFVIRSSKRYTKSKNKISRERRLERMWSKLSKSRFCKKLFEEISNNIVLKYTSFTHSHSCPASPLAQTFVGFCCYANEPISPAYKLNYFDSWKHLCILWLVSEIPLWERAAQMTRHTTMRVCNWEARVVHLTIRLVTRTNV